MSSFVQEFFLFPLRTVLNQEPNVYEMGDSDEIILRIGAVIIRALSALICAITMPYIVLTLAYRSFLLEKHMGGQTLNRISGINRPTSKSS